MPSMLTSVAFVVCQVKVVDWPGSRVFGFADSEAVGAATVGGGGGGGGGTFFAQAPRNMIVPSADRRVSHLVIIVIVILVVIACFTDSSSFLCARTVECNLQLDDLQLDDRAHSAPAAKPSFFIKTKGQKNLYHRKHRETQGIQVSPVLLCAPRGKDLNSSTQSTSNSSWAAC
jgi:hypothetical protein